MASPTNGGATRRRRSAAAALTLAFVVAALISCQLLQYSSAFSPAPSIVVGRSRELHAAVSSSPTESESATTAQASTRSSTSNATAIARDADISTKSIMHQSQILDDALNSNATASTALISELAALRRADKQDEAEAYLDGLLSMIDGSSAVPVRNSQPLWARRLPVTARFSRRARLASMGRVLDLSTPSAEDDGNGEDDDDEEEAARGRRRRALSVMLRTLSRENDEEAEKRSEENGSDRKRLFRAATRPAIRRIERAAIKDSRNAAEWDDMANRLPQGLETPTYDVIVRRPKYEIRTYDAFTVCTVPMKRTIRANDVNRSKTDAKISNPQLSGASSFGALAGYLFGKNSGDMPMAMTTPVLTTNAGSAEEEESDSDDAGGGGGATSNTGKEMSFVLPSTYWTEDGAERAPQPLDGSNVRLQRDEGGDRAVIMFGGFTSKAVVEEKKMQLLKDLQDDRDYMIKEGSTATLAQYNDPFTPPWKRRNEVSVPVVRRDN